MNNVRSKLRHLSSTVDRMMTSSVSSRSPTPERRGAERRVSFAERPEQWTEFPRSYYRAPRSMYAGQQRPVSFRGNSCDRCGRYYAGACLAENVTCFACGRRGHKRARHHASAGFQGLFANRTGCPLTRHRVGKSPLELSKQTMPIIS